MPVALPSNGGNNGTGKNGTKKNGTGITTYAEKMAPLENRPYGLNGGNFKVIFKILKYKLN